MGVLGSSAMDVSKVQDKTKSIGGHGICGAGMNCSGGGGQCGAGMNCGGGGGVCGAGMNCGGR